MRTTATHEEVRRAQDSFGLYLRQFPWFRGIGYIQNSCIGDTQPFKLSVRVARYEHVALVPNEWDGFPVEVLVVGDIVALSGLPPGIVGVPDWS